MDAVGIIPARYGSTRFEGKLLADFCGKPVIQHTWENAKKSNSINDLIIATDDKRIYNAAKGFGANVVYTSIAHKSGSDRLTEVAASIDTKIVVNIQADEPLLHYTMIDDVVEAILKDNTLVMATLCHKIKNAEEIQDSNVVKVVFDRFCYALYFSRSSIPYERMGSDDKLQVIDYYKHIGIYAYAKDFLFTFKSLPQSRLEKTEKLEQLRVLENGYRIKVIETKFDTIGIDTPEDLEKAIEIVKGKQ
ncbi:MAG: 3-deoxy-manno-octulosonate cytidylyltransferase [Candidatus Omnitrophica bacterium CG1_02_40_15]|nr:MAG: 3-deoxy-manno-octulosonate cytidylyltransferase [Candidatus Omnitrophica bacterium CG1_02_40_15]